MRKHSTLAVLAATAAGLVLNPFFGGEAGAQETAAQTAVPQVVSKVVAMGPDRARLTVDFDTGEPLALSLSDGQVRMGSEVLGSYTPGGTLDQAWRALISSTLPLEDGVLLDALVEWEPPTGLTGDELRVAQRMDRFLEERFDSTATRALTAEREARELALQESLSGLSSLALLSRLDALAGLSDAIEALDDANLRVVVDDYLEIPAGTRYAGSLLVVDGQVELAGTVAGDVLVVDGNIDLLPGSRITGDLSLSESDLDDEGGRVEGRIVRLERDMDSLESDLRETLRKELRNEFREESRDRSIFRPFGRFFGGIGEALGELFKVLILGGIGILFLNFAGPNMDTVSDVARNSTGRAALVGLAGASLFFPVWILGIVGLAVTIIGIPAILLWLPLFPAAVALAALMGYLAVARNVGSWLSRQNYGWAEWVRVTQPGTLIFGGLLVFAAPFVAAHLLEIVGFLGVLAVLLKISGSVMILFAASVGFGAVLLSRGGRRPEDWGADLFSRPFAGTRWGRDWEAEAFDAELAEEEKGESDGHAGDPEPGDHRDAHGRSAGDRPAADASTERDHEDGGRDEDDEDVPG